VKCNMLISTFTYWCIKACGIRCLANC